MISFVLISALLMAYFIYMSTEDIKTKTVPVFPSNLLIGVLFGAYFASCFYYRQIPDVFALFIGISLLVLFIKRRLFVGSADAKALFICFLASPYLSQASGMFSWTSRLNPMIPGMVYFLAAIPFIVYCFVEGKKNGKSFKEILTGKKSRTAFFPFLLTGYTSLTALGMASFF